MDFIPPFRFVASLIVFGLLLFIFNPIVDWLNESFPTSGDYATVMFFFWGALAGIFLLAAGIQMLMEIQKKGY